ncbi:hypothetical protein LB535_20850 [Mesorhizobium sp. CA10]|uniref:hypothetical protein n=1 Tax=Mesorhizobium sp. CA10 TaxID=588495 RepID=UPI001CCEDF7A|nr:hypothetical protein [Mesorhizobium sp. CA10]MBZ9884800.1 hypothetical protein [Mesorhizobium sp. CA10]
MPGQALDRPAPYREALLAPVVSQQLFQTRATLLAAGLALLTATGASGAELQRSCIEPPATVIKIAGVGTKHARATAKFTEPDIVNACHEGYVNQGGYASPEECIRDTKASLLGHAIDAEANCSRGTIKLGQMSFRMPVENNCASGGIFAASAFTMLCPRYRGRIVSD